MPRSEALAIGARIFKPRVVLKIKWLPPTPDHPLGQLDKFKYRLTIAAFTKMLTQGIDYAEKHANTVRWQALLVMLALAAQNDFDIVLFDIATFFLYGEIDNDNTWNNLHIGTKNRANPVMTTSAVATRACMACQVPPSVHNNSYGLHLMGGSL